VVDCTFVRALVEALITLELAGQARFDYGFREGLCLPSTLPTLSHTGVGIPQTSGESGYISNISEHHVLHPGSANGQNVFCVGRNAAGLPVYLGFGPFFATPKTAAEIIEYLYQATILPYIPTGDSYIDLRFNFLIKQFKNYREVWDKMREEAQAIAPRRLITLTARAIVEATQAKRNTRLS
jgi:hypothetical protein